MPWSIDSTLTWFANNFATLLLVFATLVLAYYSRSLVNVTKGLGQIERERQRPILDFAGDQPAADSKGEYVRFSVFNKGLTPAFDPKAKAKVEGRILKVREHSVGKTIVPYSLFYWDILGVKVGENIEIEVDYSDSLGKPQPKLTHIFVAR